MSPDKLIYMANQIATFFDSQPKGERVDRIALHIHDYWEPRMRRQLFEILDAGDTNAHPMVIAAVEKLRQAA